MKHCLKHFQHLGVVTTKARIDFEQVQTITFYLVAYDIGEPQLSVVANVTVNVININDMNPVFEKVRITSYYFQNSLYSFFYDFRLLFCVNYLLKLVENCSIISYIIFSG